MAKRETRTKIQIPKKARQSPIIKDVEPMLATLTGEAFDRPGWLFEIKWDGYRAIAEVSEEGVKLYSRNQLDFVEMFPPVVEDLHRLGFEAVLDGEVVVVDEEGRAHIKQLQHYRTTGEGRLVYYVYDLLFYDGYDLRLVPAWERKALLQQVLPPLPYLKYSAHLEEQGKRFYEVARQKGVEGIIAKDKNSQYRTGVRSTEWLKIKVYRQQEAVIGGYTEPRGTRKDLGALLLGVYEGKDLVFIGHAGGGFDAENLKQVKSRLEPLIRSSSPFKNKPKTNTPATWVHPELVCEVQFSGWSKEKIMLHPIFAGLREDKHPRQMRREEEIPTFEALEQKKFAKHEEERETVEIGGHSLELTNLSKPYWTAEGITKGDMVAYYRAVAPYILPYLKDRPESLHRFPDGIEGKSFFQKDFDHAPDWVQRVSIEMDSQGTIDYLVCQDEATLVYMANLGSIEIHPWNSRLDSLDHPDYLVIDLDPDELPFEDVMRVALEVRRVLEEIEIRSTVKTSGQRGMHVYIPLGARYTYEQTRQFALLIGQLVNSRLPEITSLERSPKKRKGLLYLDYLQNRRGQTLAAPYSLRPRPGAPVSTPLRWEEVGPGLSPLNFTIRNILDRLDRLGDLWQPVLGPGIDMEKGLDRLRQAWTKK